MSHTSPSKRRRQHKRAQGRALTSAPAPVGTYRIPQPRDLVCQSERDPDEAPLAYQCDQCQRPCYCSPDDAAKLDAGLRLPVCSDCSFPLSFPAFMRDIMADGRSRMTPEERRKSAMDQGWANFDKWAEDNWDGPLSEAQSIALMKENLRQARRERGASAA